MRNMVSISKFESYNEKEPMLINHRIKRDFMIKMYGIYLTQMTITCLICSLCLFQPVISKLENEIAWLIIFIVCFPINITLGILLSCVRKITKYSIVLIIFFTLGTSSFTYIYFYFCRFIDTRIIISFILVQISGAVGRLVYGI